MPRALPPWLLPGPVLKKKRKLPKVPRQDPPAYKRQAATANAESTKGHLAGHLEAVLIQQAALLDKPEASWQHVTTSSSSTPSMSCADAANAAELSTEGWLPPSMMVKYLSVLQAQKQVAAAVAVMAGPGAETLVGKQQVHGRYAVDLRKANKKHRKQVGQNMKGSPARRCGQCRTCLRPLGKQGCLVLKARREAGALNVSTLPVQNV